MTEKVVYDPKEHASNQKNTGAKKNTEESKATAPTKQKRATKKPRADEPLHAKDGDVDAEEPVTEFKAKLNKYGFIHVPKKARSSLPFELEKPLMARIDGKRLVIAAAAK